tara:strand:- start:100 stop:405 length:306 start_codon:yes stop_codon:yes gene_type:complete
MKAALCFWSNGSDYADISIYVPVPDGPEWQFTVSLDKDDGGPDWYIYNADPQVSPDHEDAFDLAEGEPPEDVVAAFWATRPEAVRQLSEIMVAEAGYGLGD